MKYSIIYFITFLLTVPFPLSGQTVDIHLPYEANNKYAFALNKGIEIDTIQKGTIPLSGNIKIKIPEKDKGYIGMGTLFIGNDKPINLIVNNESFHLEQNTATSKYIFKNSKENDFLYSIMQEGKFPESNPNLYASQFVELMRFMQQLNKVTTQQVDLMEKANTRLYALDKLDMEKLYTSSIWYNMIDGLTRLSLTQEAFGNDMVRLLKRMDNQEVFEHLANNLITITEQYGWDDAFDIIVPYIKESGKIKIPQGNMYAAFAQTKIQKGTLAPDIEGLQVPFISSGALYTLLTFYEPDCENCNKQMDLLIKDFPRLKQLGVRIVSISATTEKANFKHDLEAFPWDDKDKLCDFHGFSGQNFITYGIMSTPTFFLIDKNGKIIKRYAKISDIKYINTEN